MTRLALRAWQAEALPKWEENRHRGIVSVVTGGGKTVFALACVERLRPKATLVVVPTVALLDQWWQEVASFFELDLDEVNIVSKRMPLRTGTVNLAVINTAASMAPQLQDFPCFLIVDECHKAASEKFKAVFQIPTVAALGLSATPERPYDEGLKDVLVPALGEVIYKYDYGDALRDGVIVPFRLHNLIFELEEEERAKYDKLTKSIAVSISRHGIEAPETIGLLLKRARVLNLSLNRVRLALRLVAAHRGKRILIFHESIEACTLIFEALKENSVPAGVYHSQLDLRSRAAMLLDFRHGRIDVLVTCRALDEGFNVPETQIGIIAASTATRRQRIQRLGRILRPAKGKEAATIYSLVATEPEVDRLREEERTLEGVADVVWSRAT